MVLRKSSNPSSEAMVVCGFEAAAVLLVVHGGRFLPSCIPLQALLVAQLSLILGRFSSSFLPFASRGRTS